MTQDEAYELVMGELAEDVARFEDFVHDAPSTEVEVIRLANLFIELREDLPPEPVQAARDVLDRRQPGPVPAPWCFATQFILSPQAWQTCQDGPAFMTVVGLVEAGLPIAPLRAAMARCSQTCPDPEAGQIARLKTIYPYRANPAVMLMTLVVFGACAGMIGWVIWTGNTVWYTELLFLASLGFVAASLLGLSRRGRVVVSFDHIEAPRSLLSRKTLRLAKVDLTGREVRGKGKDRYLWLTTRTDKLVIAERGLPDAAAFDALADATGAL